MSRKFHSEMWNKLPKISNWSGITSNDVMKCSGKLIKGYCTTSSKLFSETKSRSSSEIVKELDKHIVGQSNAKKSLAIALKDRWRRQQVSDPILKGEITPNNILLIGPSGCGKTELAKRLAAFADAPFVKVVATKYTEVGFVGENTHSMVQDLAEQALSDVKSRWRKHFADDARLKTYLNLAEKLQKLPEYSSHSQDNLIDRIKSGELDDVYLEVESDLLCSHDDQPSNPLYELMNSVGDGRQGGHRIAPFGMAISAAPGGDFSTLMSDFFSDKKKQKKPTKRRVKIVDAIPQMDDHFASEMIKDEDVIEEARESAEQRGIIFIDEFDKLVDSREGPEFRSKRRGVQKELLTLMEGTTVSTRIGRISTNHVLFIASGAFHSCKPTDIMPELQGRLPIRSDLQPLTLSDFVEILKVRYNLLVQQKALLGTENINLEFSDDAIKEIARISYQLNTVSANVGARRLKTVIAKLLEDIKFDAENLSGTTVHVTKDLVESQLSQLLQQCDLSKYII